MSKALANALAIAMYEQFGGAPDEVSFNDCKQFANQFVEDNLDLLGPPVIVDMQGRQLGQQPVAAVPTRVPGMPWQAGDTVQVRAQDEKVAARFLQAQRGPDGLTANQSAGIARGARLCSNCQQPELNDEPPYFGHAPGCSRIPGMGSDMRATTKPQLPPLS